MGRDWIEDEKRPGGIGRSERERLFWERVASGRRRAVPRPRAKRLDPDDPDNLDKAARGSLLRLAESVEMAIVTVLSVVVFGLGWATLETERSALANDPEFAEITAETRYAVPTDTVEPMDPDTTPRRK